MDYLLRHGQTAVIRLDYTVNGQSLFSYDPDELEFSFGGKSYLLSDGGIVWDEDEQALVIYLDQTDTNALPATCSYQLRVLKDGQVGISSIGYIKVGMALSTAVLTGTVGGLA